MNVKQNQSSLILRFNMDQQQQSVQETHATGNGGHDQAYQYPVSQIESHTKPPLYGSPAADCHAAPLEGSQDPVLNSNQISAHQPHQIFQGSTQDTNKPTMHPQSPENLQKEEMIPNMPSGVDFDPSGAHTHSIFSSQVLQRQNQPDQRDNEEIAQFNQHFPNMEINPSQSLSLQQQNDLGPNSQTHHGYPQFQPGNESPQISQHPPHGMQYNPQMQMMREAQFQQRAQAQQNDGQQFMSPGKLSMGHQMFPQKAVISQKSEMASSMTAAPYFNQGFPSDVLSYQTDDEGLNQRNQKHQLFQNAQNTMYLKNNQTDIMNSSQRKMSDNLIYQKANNKNVLLDENVNKLVELQDPSESASNFNQQQLSQINKLVDDDDDSYAQSESNSNFNKMHDQFQDVAISPQVEHRGQNAHSQMLYFDQGMAYHPSQQMGVQSEHQKMQVIQSNQLSQQNYQNDHSLKMGGFPSNNNQQMDKNLLNMNQYDAHWTGGPNQMNVHGQALMQQRSYSDATAQQYQGQQYMQQLAQQRKVQSMVVQDGMMAQNYHQMNQQQMEQMQPQMSQGQYQDPKFQNTQLFDQSQQASMNQGMFRAQQQQQYGAKQLPMMPQYAHQQDSNSKFLSKLEDQQRNHPLQNDFENQFDYLREQAHEQININKSMGQQMQLNPDQTQPQMSKMQEEAFQNDKQLYRGNGMSRGFPQHQMYGQDDKQQMMSADETQQLCHLMQKQMALDQKQYFNQHQAQLQHNMGNRPHEQEEMGGYFNQGYDNRPQNQFLYQQAEKPPFNESFYPQNFSQGQNQSHYLQQRHHQAMNFSDVPQNKHYSSPQQKQMSMQNSIAFQGQQNYQNFQRDESQHYYNPKAQNHYDDYYHNQASVSPNSAKYKKKVPPRNQAHSEKGGYPQSQNFIDDEPINNLNINNLSSAKRDSRTNQNQSSQIQPKIGRTRRTGSSYVQSNKPMEFIPVKVDVQDIDKDIDIDNVDDNQDQSSQGTSKNKSGYSSGSKQRKEDSSKRSSNKRRSSNNNGDEFGKDQTDCTNSGLVDTDSGHKQHNSFNEQQSFSDSRGIGKGSRGGNSHSSKSGHHSLANSNQSYDEFIQQIQHDIKKAARDPEKEFQVLDGHIIRLATKKVGSKFLQEHLGLAKQSLINKIIDQIDEHLPNLMTDNYGNYFCSELIKYLQVHQRIHFMKQIKGKKFIEISCNNRGTYTLQNIIYAVTQPEEFEIIKETLLENNNICYLAKDKEGHHMLEKIITTFKEKQRLYIFQEIMEKFNELATDKNGLCVLKKLIQHTRDEESQRQVVAKILQNEKGLEYVQDAFGNFVVSEVLNQFSFSICQDIFQCMETNFVKLSQNKFASKFIEVCIDKAPVEIQDQIVAEFCESSDLNRVVQSQFGNFVLQNSIVCQKNPKQQGYCKTEEQRIKLIHAIILSIKEVTDYKVQTKWGQDILMKFIQRIQNEHDYNRLHEMLKGEMEIINQKQKLFKQQQHIQFESYQNNPQKVQGRKNASNQGHQYPPTSFQPHYSEKGDSTYMSHSSTGNWSGSYQHRGNQFDQSQEGHYQKNATKWAQKGKNQKNKKQGNNQHYPGNQKNSGGYKNQSNQFQSNQYKQIQGKPQTLKRDNIMFADSTAFSQEGHNAQLEGQAYSRFQSDEQAHNSQELNQAAGSSRNSGIRQNSIYNDPTMLNQDSSGGTSERAHKKQPDSADQQND